MARVNPPRQLKLPDSINSNVDLKKAFDDLNFIVFQLWKRTGGGEDFIQDEMLQKLYPNTAAQDLNSLNIDLKSIYTAQSANFKPDFNLVINESASKTDKITLVTDIDLTTTESMAVLCNSAADISVTLNPEPDEDEVVIIKRVNTGAVNILTNKTIDGISSQKLTAIYDSLKVKFIGELNEWIII